MIHTHTDSVLSVHQMLAFIRAQPSVVERMLRNIETPAIGDLLVRIIQLDEQPGGAGVLEVRSRCSRDLRTTRSISTLVVIRRETCSAPCRPTLSLPLAGYAYSYRRAHQEHRFHGCPIPHCRHGELADWPRLQPLCARTCAKRYRSDLG